MLKVGWYPYSSKYDNCTSVLELCTNAVCWSWASSWRQKVPRSETLQSRHCCEKCTRGTAHARPLRVTSREFAFAIPLSFSSSISATHLTSRFRTARQLSHIDSCISILRSHTGDVLSRSKISPSVRRLKTKGQMNLAYQKINNLCL